MTPQASSINSPRPTISLPPFCLAPNEGSTSQLIRQTGPSPVPISLLLGGGSDVSLILSDRNGKAVIRFDSASSHVDIGGNGKNGRLQLQTSDGHTASIGGGGI